MSERVLSQNEIDELFSKYSAKPIVEEAVELLTMQELDTIGEIGNICMGTAATTLSELLNTGVVIGYPETIVCHQEEVFRAFSTPYMIIDVRFKSGLKGFNVLVITEEDIALIADIMMGGTGQVQQPVELNEIEISAATEVMNQMIGAAATAMSNVFGVTVDIEPPGTTMVKDPRHADHAPLLTEKPVVVARFEVTIRNLFKTTFMQITDVDTAREEAYFLLMNAGVYDKPTDGEGKDMPAALPTLELAAVKEPACPALPNLSRVLTVPLEVALVMGRLPWTMGDAAKLSVGSEIETPFRSDQVELVINGVTVARGAVLPDGKVRITQTGE